MISYIKDKVLTDEEKRIMRDEVNLANYQTLTYYTSVWLPLSFVSIAAQTITGADLVRYMFSIALCTYFVVMAILLRTRKPSRIDRATELIYYVQIIPLTIGILLGTVLDRTHQAFTIYLFIAMMPVLILDRKRKVFSWITGWVLLFLLMSFITKDRSLFIADLIYLGEIYLVSITAGMIVINTRVYSIYNYVKALPSTTDMLTGLYSMPRFLEYAVDKRDNAEDPISIAYFNISGLKKYNQIYGYPEGSKLLKETAYLISGTFGRDNCARLSDDHFVVLDDSYIIRDKIDETVESLNNISRNCRIYAGIYEFKSDEKIELAMDKARLAAGYLKKYNSESRIQYYDDEFRKKEEHRQYIQYHLDEALEKGWIKAYYQPIIRTETERICSEESLARWVDPKLGFMTPAAFVPILEELRMLHKLDLEIVRQAVRDMAVRREEGMELSPVSINLSRYDLETMDMVTAITEIVDAGKIDRGLIIIEITESALISDEDLIGREINRFHEAGFKVWMDDFGSGWSSLNLLTKFHFDLIKLDMQFAMQMKAREDNIIVIRHLIEMAKQLGIETLAEGIETEEQYEVFKKLGCNKLQGFLFDKPNTLEYILNTFRSGNGIPFEDTEDKERYEIKRTKQGV